MAFDEQLPQGLTEQEARERLAQDGHNELPAARRRTLWRTLWDVVREPIGSRPYWPS